MKLLSIVVLYKRIAKYSMAQRVQELSPVVFMNHNIVIGVEGEWYYIYNNNIYIKHHKHNLASINGPATFRYL